MRRGQVVLIALLLAAGGAFILLDLGQYFSLDYLKSQKLALLECYEHHSAVTILVYFLVYVLVTALSVPGAAVMTLAGGAIFGVATGTLIVSFASSLGATLAFLAARYLFRDAVQTRFGTKLRAINEGIEREGSFYLFTLRLIPLFPFFVINLAMGLTPLRTAQFYVVSQIGMLPGTLVYVNAGSQLGAVESLSGILSPGLLLSFALLGIFPLIARKGIEAYKTRKALGRFTKPARFDYNLVVIGAGSAGLVSAYIAATAKAKVALIEKHKMGGDCLNTGCVPSKALIRSAQMLSFAQRAQEFGFRQTTVDFDFAEVMERVQRIIRQVEPHDSVERYSRLGVECINGAARIVTPYEVEVDGRRLTTRSIIVATGARPAIPALPGLNDAPYLTSETVWNLRALPRRLVVLGGGPIGCELAQCFQRFGSQVTLVQRGTQLLPREDPDIAERVRQRFLAEGMRVLTSCEALRVVRQEGSSALICQSGVEQIEIPFDCLLVALGRRAHVGGLGLEALGVELEKDGTVAANGFMQTSIPNILVCGDVAGPYQFTHTAAHQAWYAAVNALFGRFKRFRVDYSVIPWATYTDPQVARVGLNETDAKAQGIAYEVTTYDLEELDRAITDGENQGVVKVLTVPGKDHILGATIVGEQAGELIIEFITAMKHDIGLNKILGTIHIYPTLAEANKYVAGAWKRAHLPQRLLPWVARFHSWRRHEGLPEQDAHRSETSSRDET